MSQYKIVCFVVLIMALNTGRILSVEFTDSGVDKECHFQELNLTDCQQELPVGTCITFNQSTKIVIAGLCPYEQDLTGNVSLDLDTFALKLSVHSGQELNEALCGPLNRKGLLCGKFKPGYGTAVYSKTFKCVQCNDRYKFWMWVMYVLLETVPLTLLYFVIIIFNIQATSPPFTSFLFHSIGYKANQTLLWLTMTVVDIWNLDALRHLVPLFCIDSSLSNFHVQLIRVLFTLYPAALVTISYILIELHARNCIFIILLWKPFHRYFAHLRRQWDPRSSNITAFSTLILLSLLKMWSSTLYLLFSTEAAYSNGDPAVHLLYVDPNIQFNKETSLRHYWPAAFMIFATLTPTVILCLYPTRVCRKLFKLHKSQTLKQFVETFQGHYKDGTNGTHDYRAVSSLVFILRILAGLAFYPHTSRAGNPENTFSLVMVYILMVISLLYAIAQPCKKRYMNNLYALTALSFLYIAIANLKPSAEHKNLRSPMANI